MIDEFFLRPFLAGLAVAVAAGTLGCLVIWRRMAYFGDALGHAGILGAALALGAGVSLLGGVLVIAILFGLSLLILERADQSADTILGVLSQTALAIGLLVATSLPSGAVNLEGLLFGDLLAVGWADVWAMTFGAIATALWTRWQWKALLLSTMSPELAQAEGIAVARIRYQYVLFMALFIALGIKIMGALLITALLIIPAAAARNFAKNPAHMVLVSIVLAAFSLCTGLYASYYWDMIPGPMIVICAGLCFTIGRLLTSRKS